MSPVAVAVVVAAVALAVLAVLSFGWPGWLRTRAGGVPFGAPATPPSYPRALRSPAEGTYRGTERVPDGPLVRSHGLGGRGRVRVILAAEGLVLERRGTNDVLIEEQELAGAHEQDGMLVVRWRHDDVSLRTIIELDSRGEVASWVKSLEQMGRQQ